jgi:phytol kinase
LVGERWGSRKYRIVAEKSLEGSTAMFLFSFISLALGMVFFSVFYHFASLAKIVPTLAVAAVATAVEGFSPMGFDNLTVPAFSVLVFLVYGGGFWRVGVCGYRWIRRIGKEYSGNRPLHAT